MTTQTTRRTSKARTTTKKPSTTAPASTKSRPASSPAKASQPATSRRRRTIAPSPAGESSVSAHPVRDSKQSRLIEMLKAKSGATLDQMMTLTGWQAHTVRGTISGVLRKKLGLKVACETSKDHGPRRYRIIGEAVRS